VSAVVYVYDTKMDHCIGNLIKPYANVMTGFTMVEIQCPHCEEDVELEEGLSGWFSCPHCDEDFSHDEEVGYAELSFSPLQVLIITSLTILSIALIFITNAWQSEETPYKLIDYCCLSVLPIILVLYLIRLRK